MEERTEVSGEIEESVPLAANPLSPGSVKAKVPEVEVRLYRQGKGPIAVFKSNLGGWSQDQLEVGDILHKYGFKSVYAFNPDSGRGVSIRIHPRNRRSLLSYRDGSVIFIDGEPKVCTELLPQHLQSFQLIFFFFLFFLRSFLATKSWNIIFEIEKEKYDLPCLKSQTKLGSLIALYNLMESELFL